MILMNADAFAQKKAARIASLRARAARLRAAAEGLRASKRALLDCMAGTPVLVGHHSERRHRRDLDRIDGAFRKAAEFEAQAKALEARAHGAETNRAISSDDPDAVDQLRAKLERLEAARARMVAANKALRLPKPARFAALQALGFCAVDVEKLETPDFCGRVGEFEARATTPAPAAVEAPGARIEESDNRVRIVFDAKPAEDVRAALKAAGFRWAPSAGAWQRHASTQAWYQARRVLGLGASL